MYIEKHRKEMILKKERFTVRKMKMSVCTVDTANQQCKTQKNYGAKFKKLYLHRKYHKTTKKGKCK